jgi:two-component system chemotaxis sensor kinase CheA
LEGADFVKEELAKISNGQKSDGVGTTLIRHIEDFLKAIKTGTPLAPVAEPKPVPEAPKPIPSEPVQEAAPVPAKPATTIVQEEGEMMYRYKAKIHFQDGCEMENIRAYTLVHNLQDIAVDITHVPADVIDESTIEFIRNNGFEIEFSSDMEYQRVNGHLSQTVYLRELNLMEMGTVISTVAAPQEKPAAAAELPPLPEAEEFVPAAGPEDAGRKAAPGGAPMGTAPAATNLIEPRA